VKRKFALVQLFRHREPALLMSGQTVSNFGGDVALVANTLLVLETTHYSVAKLSWFAATRMTPLVVFLLLGGAIVDRFSRRVLLLLIIALKRINEIDKPRLTPALVEGR
jgi:MFS family permease